MAIYENAYSILEKACIKFCEDNKDKLYDDIVAEIYTDVLGHDYIFCKCVDTNFEYLTDWYEGGYLTIINMKYFSDLCDMAFYKKEV